MAATCGAFRPTVVTFATRGGLGFTMPPTKPPSQKKYGGYCFRATCHISDSTLGCPVAKIKGYDRTPTVGRDTESVCRVHAKRMSGQAPGTYTCGEAEVVMLPATDLECTGQMYFVMDGEVKKLF